MRQRITFAVLFSVFSAGGWLACAPGEEVPTLDGGGPGVATSPVEEGSVGASDDAPPSTDGASSPRDADAGDLEDAQPDAERDEAAPDAAIGPGPIGVFGDTLCLNADGPGGEATYPRIERILGTGAIEAPSDGVYVPPRPHVEEREDDGAVGPHFAILAIEPTDVNLDLVPMTDGGDRSRTEIKLAPSSGGIHQPFKGHEGDTFVYTWRFRIDPGMRFASTFTHIHQIKANGGLYAEPPLITFTPVASGVMDVRHVGDLTTSSVGFTRLGSMPLAGVPGQWMDVREEITYSNTVGQYKLTIRDQLGAVALALDVAGLQMWRTGANHMRPKWGVYRFHNVSLNQDVDDYLYLANIGITHGATPTSTCR